MREHLIQYVNLLFAGTSGTEEIKQEILQNTLDRFDDLVAQGKSPEAAYSLAISGIGDISEILGSARPAAPVTQPAQTIQPEYRSEPVWKKLTRAGAVFLYIICAIPLFILSEFGMDTLGLCATISIAAVATVAIIVAGNDEKEPKEKDRKAAEVPQSPQQELRSAIKKIVNTVGLILYFVISFSTGAWHITWLIFPIKAAVWNLIKAIMDIKEAESYET